MLISCNQRHNVFVSQEKVRVLQTYSRRKKTCLHVRDLLSFSIVSIKVAHIKQFATDLSLCDTDIHGYNYI